MKKKIKRAENAAEYDRGTDHEYRLVEEVLIFARTIDRWAIPLQRMWRIRALRVAQRNVWRRHYAILIIQRSLRAVYGRRCKVVGRVSAYCEIKILNCWMMLLSRRRTAVFQTAVYRMTRVILPKMKRFLKAWYESWILKRKVSSMKIQSMIMMYSGKVRKVRRAGNMYYMFSSFHDAVTFIQKLYRGYKGRLSLTSD